MTDAARLPTSLSSRNHQIHRWFNFIAGFSPEFVRARIEELDDPHDGFVLDPFAGAGTTLVEAQSLGLDSVGYEPHPFFAEMARAKLASDLLPDDIDLLEDTILESMGDPISPDDVWSPTPLIFLRKVLPEGSLAQLAPFPSLVEAVAPRLRAALRLIVSRTLEGSSGSRTDGIYKAPSSLKRPRAVAVVARAVCAEMREDLVLAGLRHPARVIEHPAGAEVIKGASLCVTSPPYLNNFDFAEMTRMELYFWRWAESWREITELVRSRLLVNTTTAPSQLKGGREQFSEGLSGDLLDAAESLYSELATACDGRSKHYDRLVFPYVRGLDEILGASARSLKHGASIHVVVADSALYGVHVPLHDLVALMLRGHGCRDIGIEHLRSRGERWMLAKRQGPPGKLGEYWVSATT